MILTEELRMMKTNRFKKAVTWTLQILLAMIFLTVGMAKLSGVESTIQLFKDIGVGQWLRYFTGVIEVTSAILLLFGPYATLGAGLLVCTMLGATLTHLWLIGGSVLPPLSLGVASAILVYLRQSIRRSEELESFQEESNRKSA
jgi:uncharacterized membrane protein YphA (DoxX/SURF4 family)